MKAAEACISFVGLTETWLDFRRQLRHGDGQTSQAALEAAGRHCPGSGRESDLGQSLTRLCGRVSSQVQNNT